MVGPLINLVSGCYDKTGDFCPSSEIGMYDFKHANTLDPTKPIEDPMALAKLYYDAFQQHKGYKPHNLKDFAYIMKANPPNQEEEGDDEAKIAESQSC